MPVGFELVKKPVQFCDVATHQRKRCSDVTTNELFRNLFKVCLNDYLKLRYVVMDSWFAAHENFVAIRAKGKHFIAALKDNRLVALSEADRAAGHFTRIEQLDLPEKPVLRRRMKGDDEPVLLIRAIFTNKDGSTEVRNLAGSDLTCEGDSMIAFVQKRWKVEAFHKSLKSNAALAKSPTRSITTQSNHVFLAICTVFKLETLNIQHKINHFALRSKLYLKPIRQAYEELLWLRSNCAAAGAGA